MDYPKKLVVDFNKEWAERVGKEKFVEHFKDVYPSLDLKKEYDKIVKPEKEDKK